MKCRTEASSEFEGPLRRGHQDVLGVRPTTFEVEDPFGTGLCAVARRSLPASVSVLDTVEAEHQAVGSGPSALVEDGVDRADGIEVRFCEPERIPNRFPVNCDLVFAAGTLENKGSAQAGPGEQGGWSAICPQQGDRAARSAGHYAASLPTEAGFVPASAGRHQGSEWEAQEAHSRLTVPFRPAESRRRAHGRLPWPPRPCRRPFDAFLRPRLRGWRTSI